MPEALDTYDFSRGRPGSTEYDQFLDGQVWRLTLGVDVPEEAEKARQRLQRAARRNGLRSRSAIEDDALVFQALQPKPEDGNGHPA